MKQSIQTRVSTRYGFRVGFGPDTTNAYFNVRLSYFIPVMVRAMKFAVFIQQDTIPCRSFFIRK